MINDKTSRQLYVVSRCKLTVCCNPPLCSRAWQMCRRWPSSQSRWPSPLSVPGLAVCNTGERTDATNQWIFNRNRRIRQKHVQTCLTISQSRAKTPAFPSGGRSLLKVETYPSNDVLRPSWTCCCGKMVHFVGFHERTYPRSCKLELTQQIRGWGYPTLDTWHPGAPTAAAQHL